LNNYAKVPNNPAGFDVVFDLARTDELEGSELQKYLTSMLDRYYVYSTTEYARRERYKKGVDAGREEGREETKLSIAKTLLSKNIPVEDIAEATGFSQDAILALK
jgi:predicted transposase/invertase (TIGR01784 family)